MDFEMSEQLTLGNFAGGQLEKDFQAAYQEVIRQLSGKEKGTITISLIFEGVPETDTMMTTSYTMKKTVPAKAKKTLAVRAEKGLKTEKPKEPPQPLQLAFDKKGESVSE